MNYRKAGIANIPTLVALKKQQLLDAHVEPLKGIDNELIDYFTASLENGSYISYLAIEDNRIIGTSGICFYKLCPSHSNPTGLVAYITNMFTFKEYRKQGIASTMLKLMLDEAKQRNCNEINLHASPEGKGIYSKAGFKDLDGYMSLII